MPQPEVLLLDEPFSALDAFTRRDLQDHLLDLWADTRPTLVLVTHDVDEAVVLADRVLVMRPRPGRLFEEIKINLARPRDRNSPLFDNFKRRVLTALDRSLDRNVPDADPKSTRRSDVVVTSAPITHYIRLANLREIKMDAAELRATQAPIKDRYKTDPKAAMITLKARARSITKASPARSRPAARWRSPACIPPPAAPGLNCAPATCCWKPWSPAPA